MTLNCQYCICNKSLGINSKLNHQPLRRCGDITASHVGNSHMEASWKLLLSKVAPTLFIVKLIHYRPLKTGDLFDPSKLTTLSN